MVASAAGADYLPVMPRNHFSHVDTWVFDLDNTLYPPSIRLFDQIQARMTDYVMEALGLDTVAASALRQDYWHRYGTTLSGLIQEHGLDPEPYLQHVHDIDLTEVAPTVPLGAAITALPGRKIVYTNGSRTHARRVTEALGIAGAFDALYGFEDAGYKPKPQPEAFARVFATAKFAPERAAMFEDDPRNLAVPHELGMRTVLVGPALPETDFPAAHVDHRIADLAEFLARLA